MANRLLVTGAAGFIGAHAAAALARAGWQVTGCDNFNAYYDPALKHARVASLLAPAGVPCHALDLCDAPALGALFEQHRFSHVLNLAAQAGVRHSSVNPDSYIQSNLVGFANLLEACRRQKVAHLVYASSSSVYGARADAPFREEDDTTHPLSLYAATKRANELLAHSHAHQYRLPCTGLRFFTVYGPWGRPDMAYFSFAERLARGAPVPVFGQGELRRDFTYIDDVVQALCRLLERPCQAAGDAVPHSVFNIGNRQPVSVLAMLRLLEAALGATAQISFTPTPSGEVPETSADTARLKAWVGFEPATPLAAGLQRFAAWWQIWDGQQNKPAQRTQ